MNQLESARQLVDSLLDDPDSPSDFLSRFSQTRPLFHATDLAYWTAWLSKLKHTINEDGSVDVQGDVDLARLKLAVIPFTFRRVSGGFRCSYNQLTSLAGCPREVGGHFYCSANQLTSLAGCPREVNGGFYCANSQLTSLAGCPREVGGAFICSGNQLTSLAGCPREVGGGFYCYDNQLTSLAGCPREVGGDFNCYGNQLTSLAGCPNKVGGDFYCHDNQLTSLKGIGMVAGKVHADEGVARVDESAEESVDDDPDAPTSDVFKRGKTGPFVKGDSVRVNLGIADIAGMRAVKATVHGLAPTPAGEPQKYEIGLDSDPGYCGETSDDALQPISESENDPDDVSPEMIKKALERVRIGCFIKGQRVRVKEGDRWAGKTGTVVSSGDNAAWVVLNECVAAGDPDEVRTEKEPFELATNESTDPGEDTTGIKSYVLAQDYVTPLKRLGYDFHAEDRRLAKLMPLGDRAYLRIEVELLAASSAPCVAVIFVGVASSDYDVMLQQITIFSVYDIVDTVRELEAMADQTEEHGITAFTRLLAARNFKGSPVRSPESVCNMFGESAEPDPEPGPASDPDDMSKADILAQFNPATIVRELGYQEEKIDSKDVTLWVKQAGDLELAVVFPLHGRHWRLRVAKASPWSYVDGFGPYTIVQLRSKLRELEANVRRDMAAHTPDAVNPPVAVNEASVPVESDPDVPEDVLGYLEAFMKQEGFTRAGSSSKGSRVLYTKVFKLPSPITLPQTESAFASKFSGLTVGLYVPAHSSRSAYDGAQTLANVYLDSDVEHAIDEPRQCMIDGWRLPGGIKSVMRFVRGLPVAVERIKWPHTAPANGGLASALLPVLTAIKTSLHELVQDVVDRSAA